MATEIVLPQWSMGMADGTIVRWLKQEGELVMEGEPLVEVEAAKVTSEVEAEVSGVLARILVAEGETVPVRSALCVIGTAEEERTGISTSVPPAASPPRGTGLASSSPIGERLQRRPKPGAGERTRWTNYGRGCAASDRRGGTFSTHSRSVGGGTSHSGSTATGERSRRRFESVARQWTGGRITVEDVQRVIAATAHSAPPAPPASSSTGQVIPLTGMRGTVARRMQHSLQTSAQVTLVTEVDVSALVQLREELKPELGLTYTDVIIKAVALALKEHPRLNAWIQEEQLQLVQDIHIGMAVALDEGLIVPVVRNADRKSLREIAQETGRLAQRAREGTLTREEVIGSTFSVSNLGMYGVDAFTPIINPPEIAILGIGRINEKLVRVLRGAEWHHMMTLSLTFDHRAIDGAPASAFLQTIGKHLEQPAGLT